MGHEDSPKQGTPEPAEGAGGLPALLNTGRHVLRQTGLIRGLRVLSAANQKRGFDCPGCAWPDPTERSLTEFCENGAKAILDEATSHRITPAFFQEHSVSYLRERSDRWLNDQGRIVSPWFLAPGREHFEPITIDAALGYLAKELSALQSPHRAAFYTSGRASNEAAFLFQLLARTLGTNNLPDCSNLCHESSGVALKETLGVGKATVTYEDFGAADLILVVGQNPGSNHPRMLSTLKEARERGAVIASINPLREPGLVRFAHPQVPADWVSGGEPLGSHFVRVQPGGDQALFRGISRALLEMEQAGRRGRGGVDREFLRAHTHGVEAYLEAVWGTEWATIEQQAGVPRSEIEQLAELCLASGKIICTWAMGLTQHAHSVAIIQEIVCFLLLTGNIGRRGAGACPVRGHSNVQGDRTMGITSSPDAHFLDALEKRFDFAAPREPGLDVVGLLHGLLDGQVSHLVSLGGNLSSASPDTAWTNRALDRLQLNTQIATKLNHSHLRGQSILLLPCLGRTERHQTASGPQLLSTENTMGLVQASEGHLAPASDPLLGEPTLIARLGAQLEALRGQRATIPWLEFAKDYGLIRAAIEQVVPGFTGYGSAMARREPLELPNSARDRSFSALGGRAEFRFGALGRLRPRDGELILTTIRSHDQFNTTIYSDDDRYRGVYGNRKVVLVHPEDLAARAIEPGQRVSITSHFEDVSGPSTRSLEGFQALAFDVPRGTAFAYFPEANPLFFLNSYASRSRTPTSKAVRITLRSLGRQP